jgi:chaperonin GroES
MTFRPLQDRVVVRRVDPEHKTAGGIFIPDTAQEKPMEGTVVAVGPGARLEGGKVHPLDVEVGDRVLFGKWSGTEIKIDGEELIIIKERATDRQSHRSSGNPRPRDDAGPAHDGGAYSTVQLAVVCVVIRSDRAREMLHRS